MSEERDATFDQLIAGIRALPEVQQQDALLGFVASLLRSIDDATLKRLQPSLTRGLGRTSAGRQILEVVDGHLALRELMATSPAQPPDSA